jgi:outer membrane protein, heavy metal efflux system
MVGVPIRAQPPSSTQPAPGGYASPPQSPVPTPDPSPATVSLRGALDAAWSRAVAQRESEGQRRRAEADRTVANSFLAAPPSLDISHRNDRLHRNVGSRETEIGIAVPLWLPGQRTARAHAAEVSIANALMAEQVARLRLAGELREVAWQIAALEAEAMQIDAQAQTLRQLGDDVERRVRAGDLAPVDALAAQAEQLAASAAQADVRQRLQAARARWTLLTGLTAAPDLTTQADTATGAGALPETAPPHPELQLADLSTELARQRLELIRLSRREAPELTVGMRQDRSARGDASQGSLVVGLRLPLGTDGRNRPLEAAAMAELDVAQSHAQRLRERLNGDLVTARDALQVAQVQHKAESARAALLRERASLFEKSFHAGETPLPDLLRALSAAAQADSAVARQTTALGLARARVQQTLGLLP